LDKIKGFGNHAGYDTTAYKANNEKDGLGYLANVGIGVILFLFFRSEVPVVDFIRPKGVWRQVSPALLFSTIHEGLYINLDPSFFYCRRDKFRCIATRCFLK
jgi:hypothetical protein